ncbi:MAG: adenylosuccinate lyase family protein [Boseongicola sp.]|nr:MAG: adenylosuccinate lyase family protein [Boseongicola sp.]
MPTTPLDSALYRDLFGDVDVGQMFTDTAEIRAMMLVEGALAKVQGELGVIPNESAAAIHRASMEIQIDPSSLATATGENCVPVPALIAAFRKEMNAPEHAQYVHWGATSQDIIDTALALRVRQALSILDDRLRSLIQVLGNQAEQHAELAMLARTYGQAAVPTSFGAVLASWGKPLLRHCARLNAVKPDCQFVSLAGAAGTLSAMPKAIETRAALARALGLGDPDGSRHSARDCQAVLAAWLTGLTGSLGKTGQDLVLLNGTGIEEIKITSGGASSTMPQKSNPVGPSVMVALSTVNAGLNNAMQNSLVHSAQRDAGAWLVEWLTLPQMICIAARSLKTSLAVCSDMQPSAKKMTSNIADTFGTAFAEALTFALAQHIPRSDAQNAVKDLISLSKHQNRQLSDLTAEQHPELDHSAIFSAAAQLGQAPAEARAFAKAASELADNQS